MLLIALQARETASVEVVTSLLDDILADKLPLKTLTKEKGDNFQGFYYTQFVCVFPQQLSHSKPQPQRKVIFQFIISTQYNRCVFQQQPKSH